MTRPSEAAVLRELAQRLAEVYRGAAGFIGRAEESNRLREEETARIAEVLAQADEKSRQRVLTTRRAASAAERRAAQALSDELRYLAGTQALKAVELYAGTLAAEASERNSRVRERVARIEEFVGRLDAEAADLVRQAIARAEEERIASARRQAVMITSQIQVALNNLSGPRAEKEKRPPAKGRRRSAGSGADKQAGDLPGDVVILDPNRRRLGSGS